MEIEPASTAARADLRLTLTEYAVLGLLGHLGRPISGYDLQKVIERSVGYIWKPSKTQLYAVLRRLVGASLATRRDVEQSARPDKQLYRITSLGRAAIRAWLERDEDITEPDRSTLVLKLFFGSQGDKEALLRQLTAFRDAYALRLATYERMQAEAPARGDDEFTRLTLHYGIARARAAHGWAENALEALAG
jgi:PadR family transcriptional regulator, regulatory protein AphA